jgi:hypothetical protein
MNNFSDDDPQLTNFLRQNRSIAPPDFAKSEDRLMAEIDARFEVKKTRVLHLRSRYIWGVIGTIATGIFGATIHYMMTPPAPSMAELDRLDRYLEAHWHGVVADPAKIDRQDNLDAYLLQDDDTEDL